MCETWLQDIVVSVAYQNDCCYVRELNELTFSSLHKISMVGCESLATWLQVCTQSNTIQLSPALGWLEIDIILTLAVNLASVVGVCRGIAIQAPPL